MRLPRFSGKHRCSRTALQGGVSIAATRPGWCARRFTLLPLTPNFAISWKAPPGRHDWIGEGLQCLVCSDAAWSRYAGRMIPQTWYEASARPFEPSPPLSGPHEARIAIVGGGYAGMCLALSLAERGVRDVVLLERNGIGHGASGRNGGFVFGGYSLGEDELLRQLGPERARRLYGATTDAVELIRQRIAKYAIDCDAIDAGVIWANWFRDPEILRARQRLLAETYGVEWEWLPEAQLREVIHSRRYHDG